MFSSAEKTSKASTLAHKQAEGVSFFRKAGEQSFFGRQESPTFFNFVQPKLTVSNPNDAYEKEADHVAETVMRMPEPAPQAAGGKEEEKLQLKEEENREEEIQPKLQVPQISAIQCKEEEEQVQAKLFSSINRKSNNLYRYADSEACEDSGSGEFISCKSNSLYHSDTVQRSGRGPPETSSFEETLSNSKGSGSALPDNNKIYMESRFNADFSGVRIHTGTTAQQMSNTIHAQAFTHGNDIYFNSGKYSPDTAEGGTLLAHELTHTIQQGASQSRSDSNSIAGKVIQRNAAAGGSAVPQLNNAIAKAKSEEGKVNANKEGADGFREGWPRLVEFFKTTFGEDKIVSGAGGTSVQGSVAEQDIKKKRETEGMRPNQPRPSTANTYMRDAMPSWCGIFVFWALNKGGVPMKKWELGGKMVTPDAARLPGQSPQSGDIAYRNEFSHFALVEKTDGVNVTTINGNTSGEDNLGAQVQTRDHPISNWTAFFDPIKLKTGSLGTGEGSVEEKPKTLKELRKELFNVNRKPEIEQEETLDSSVESSTQAKPELSNLSVSPAGDLTHTPKSKVIESENRLQRKDEENKEEEVQAKEAEQALQLKAETGFDAGTPLNNHESNPADDVNATVQTGTANSSSLYNSPIQSEKESQENDRGPPIQLKTNSGTIQRSWFDTAVSFVNSAIDYAAEGLAAGKRLLLGEARDFAMAIPGYRALRVVLAEDPITGEGVDRNGKNFIEAAFDIMPGGRLLHQKLNELGALEDAAGWIDRQILSIESIVDDVISRIEVFWNGITLERLASPRAIFEDAGNIIHSTIQSIVDFAVNAAKELLETVKRFLIEQIVTFIREQTPAYPLLRVILGKDPVTDEDVPQNGTTILDALLELGGEEGREQRKQMQETGTFQKVADHIDQGIAVFSGAYEDIKAGFLAIWNDVSIEMLMHPIDTFHRIYNQFAAPVLRVWNFVRETAIAILRFIKEVLMRRLSVWAREQRGYSLVTVIIERDPFTDEVVPRTMENLIRGFMSLMEGGEAQFSQLKESGAIEKTTVRIEAAVARLNMTLAYVIQLFINIWNSFSLNDLAQPIQAFERILARFGEPIARLINFVVEIIKIVIEVIMKVMNFPSDLIANIITKAMVAFEMIKADPVGFLKNLLRAVKQGFMQFFDNVLKHLWNGLKAWFLSEVQAAGIPIPTDFSLMGILKWLLVVLDITMEKIWKKLEERMGKPKVDRIKAMINRAQQIAGAVGEAYEFIKDVQERGFMAVIADKIKEKLTNVWDMVLDAVKSFVMDQIVNKVTTKLLSMLDPTGIMAVINSAIAMYKAVQSFIRYLREMLEIVNSFVEGTIEIAQGQTKKAADFLEGSLARGMPIVIGFLANQVGLNLSERLKDALELVREKVDAGLTWVIDKIVTVVEKLVEMGKKAVGSVLGWLGLRKEFKAVDGHDHTLYTEEKGGKKELMVASWNPTTVRGFLTSLDVSGNAELTAKKSEVQLLLYAMDLSIAWMSSPAAATATDAVKEGKKSSIETLGGEISGHLAELMANIDSEKQPPVTTNPEYDGQIGPSPSGWGRGMRVQIINTPPSGGSITGTAAGHASWNALKQRKGSSPGGKTIYVQGHLLNNLLGGPGNNFNNLTPLTNTSNGEFERDAEKFIKNKLGVKTGTSNDKNSLNTGFLFIYSVIPTYGRGLNSNLIAQINGVPTGTTSTPGSPTQLTVADKTILTGIVHNEQYVPTTVKYDIIVKNPQTDMEVENMSVRNHSLENEIDQQHYIISSGEYNF